MSTLGYEKNEVCNRNGCTGIIDEHYTEQSCSCHNNPPCSYCTDDRHYCPVCDWDGRDEQIEKQKAHSNTAQGFYNHIMDKEESRANRLKEMMRTGEGITKVEWTPIGHTHFSMIKEGVYPKGMSREDLLKEIKGTFGGRFEYIKEHSFKYIAYTD